MDKAGPYLLATLLAGVALGCASCASPNVNPATARAQKGYVDFYAPGQTNLFWEVKAWNPQASAFKTVFSQLKALPDGVLRLEETPGTQEFQLTFLNRLIEAPATVQVPVQEGKVTPVKVELVPVTGTSLVTKEQKFGANVRGAGRKTRYSTQAGTVEQPTASVASPVPYRAKQQMSYPP